MAPKKNQVKKKPKKIVKKEEVQESLFQFPCEFPLKIMAHNKEGIEAFVRETLEKKVGKKDIIEISVRESREANYISITAIIIAKSKKQLDELYTLFSSHEDIKMVL